MEPGPAAAWSKIPDARKVKAASNAGGPPISLSVQRLHSANVHHAKTQLTKIIKSPRATARATQKTAVRRLKPIGDFVHTITFDNGKEFAAHQDIASVNAAPTLATPK